MKITRKIGSDEHTFELTTQELELAFREVQHMQWVDDAERQLLATFDDEPEWVEDVSEDDRQAFLQAYGFSIENAVDPESPDYILETLVTRYQSAISCDDKANNTWSNVIEAYLAEIHL